MSALERFTTGLLKIEGLKHFLLTRRDGKVVTHNLHDAEDLAAAATIAGLSASSIQEAIGFSQLHHIQYNATEGKGALVFPLDNFYLTLPDGDNPPSRWLIHEVRSFLQQLLATKEKRSAEIRRSA